MGLFNGRTLALGLMFYLEICGPAGPVMPMLPRRFVQRLGKRESLMRVTAQARFTILGRTSAAIIASYFETYQAMPVGACLVAISNLDWGGCCAYSEWHGNTIDFDAPYTVFGYVQSSDLWLSKQLQQHQWRHLGLPQ